MTSERLDGPTLREAVATAARWLEQHAEALNALNVFPVPDGDTGLNMSLTLSAAAEQAAAIPSQDAHEVAAAMARGALLGARGNSGVLLAQILRGFAREITGPEVDSPTLARALGSGAAAAYQALANPVEGTILTVARAAAEGAREAATGGLIAVLEAAHRRAKAAVAETPQLLPVLKQAGVVDAGGEGYRIVLEGLLMRLRGEPLPEAPALVTAWAHLDSLHQDEGDFYGYCTEVLFQGSGLQTEVVRQRLSALGTSVLVVGDTEMLKVHVHTLRPGAVLDLATELGEIVKVKVDNMQLQHQEFAQAARPAGPPTPSLGPGLGLVAVAAGEGWGRIFASLGAQVVPGGQTMNPSVAAIAEAIRATGRTQVIVLPNNQNIVLAAQQAAGLSQDQQVQVVPTRNLAQGIAAALALNPEASLEQNAQALATAARRVRCIEVTRAVREAQLGDLQVRTGEFFALLDDEPAGAGASAATALEQALARLPGRAYELVTIYCGEESAEAEANAIAAAAQAATGAEVEIVHGGQPLYPYILCVE